MKRWHSLAIHLYRWSENYLLAWRWWFLFLLSVAYIVVEFLEENLGSTYHLFVDLVQFILYILSLFFIWLLFELAVKNLRTQRNSTHILRIKHEISTQLALAHDWDELTDFIIQYMRPLVNPHSIFLLLAESESSSYAVVAFWSATHNIPPISAPPETICRHYHPGTIQLVPNPTLSSESQTTGHCYCLHLLISGSVAAKLIIILPTDQSLSEQQLNMFTHIAPDLANGFSVGYQRRQQTAVMLEKAADQERLSISRDLHDTLSQNLAYLRLKSEQLACDLKHYGIEEAQTELQQMCDVANKSYETVRGTLSILKSEGTAPLINLLLNHCRLITDRSQLKINVTQEGVPQVLSSATRHQIFYIVSESLSNVERHAQATQSDVHLCWCENSITLKITDNGCGFDPLLIEKEQHFGLQMMRERTVLINGEFCLQTAVGQGTQITVHLPFPLVRLGKIQ